MTKGAVHVDPYSSVVPPDPSVHFYHCPCAIAADTEDSLFIKILHCDYHILQSYLSDRPEVLYNLGNRHHNKTLIHKTVDLNDRDFLVRNLHKKTQ